VRLRASQWFALSVVLLVLVGVGGTVASVLSLQRLSDARVQLTEHLSPAAITAGYLRAAMVDQETGLRGFALTDDEALLEPYESGREETARALDELARLAALDDVEGTRDDVRAVRDAVREWQAGYAEPAVERIRREPGSGAEIVRSGAGRARFDAFRLRLTEFTEHIMDSRAQAQERLDRNADIVQFWVVGTGIVVLLTVAAVALVLRGSLVRPLQRLARDVREVAGGDFAHEVSGSGAREVVALGTDVDAMRVRILAELDALRDAEADLRRSNAELEQFAYVASHDLQEPLRKVASFCQLLQQRYGGQLDERADQYIGFAVDGARRMQDLINDLLAFSRVGRLEQPHTDVDCNVLVERVRSDLARVIEESGATLEVGPLPTVRGDASLLRLVFQNLCANAIKFRAEAPPAVSISAERDGDFWRFRVADNGIGIDPEYEERIFVLFQRLHARSEYEGTGIGLAMCRKIVEYHGGRMWLDVDATGPGRGSTFYFTLPASEESR